MSDAARVPAVGRESPTATDIVRLVPGPSVSVLVVSWQSAAWLERCLTAIDPGEAEIIVADNASTDGSAARARTVAPHATVIALERNLGFAGGVNAARAAARTPRLLLLNPDAAPTPGAIARLADALDQAPDIGAVSGRLVDADGTPQHGFNVRRLPTLASLAADLLLIDHLWPDNPASVRYYARDLDPDAPADVEQPAAACLMIRADVFDRLGGFDEAFWPAWWEDVDFCRRLAGGRPSHPLRARRGLPASGRRLGRGAGHADVRARVRRQPPALRAQAPRPAGRRGHRRAGDRRRDDARRRPRRQARPLSPRKAPVSRKIGPRLAWSR